MTRIIYKGTIDGEFNGFNDYVLFKLANGTYWIQAEYKYWYHYEYNPDVVIFQQNNKYFLTVANNTVPVIQTTNVIESHIDGYFNGWQGRTTYRLRNRQVWQQLTPLYTSASVFAPEVIIYDSPNEGYKMIVANTVVNVKRIS